MDTPGDYSQPNLYRTSISYLSSGSSVGVRLRRGDIENLVGASVLSTTNVSLYNTGNSEVTVRLKGSNETVPEGLDSLGSPSGTRYNLSGSLSIVPRGSIEATVEAVYPMLEVWGVSGISRIRAEIAGRIKWENATVLTAD